MSNNLHFFFYSSLLIPGVATLSTGLLAVAYGLCLVYLFLGTVLASCEWPWPKLRAEGPSGCWDGRTATYSIFVQENVH